MFTALFLLYIHNSINTEDNVHSNVIKVNTVTHMKMFYSTVSYSNL